MLSVALLRERGSIIARVMEWALKACRLLQRDGEMKEN